MCDDCVCRPAGYWGSRKSVLGGAGVGRGLLFLASFHRCSVSFFRPKGIFTRAKSLKKKLGLFRGGSSYVASTPRRALQSILLPGVTQLGAVGACSRTAGPSGTCSAAVYRKQSLAESSPCFFHLEEHLSFLSPHSSPPHNHHSPLHRDSEERQGAVTYSQRIPWRRQRLANSGCNTQYRNTRPARRVWSGTLR